MKTIPLSILLIALTTACASQPKAPASTNDTPPPESMTDRALSDARNGFGEAAMSPLEDINLKRDKIPQLLKDIRNPYEVGDGVTCEDIATEVNELNEILGRDWDVPPPEKAALRERAADGASTAFLDTVASEASGLIPYRGVVRSLSGANRHEKRVRKAYERGSHRRTFLKGMGLMMQCQYPASPQPMPEEADKIEFR